MPVQFSLEDLRTPEQLERVLRQFQNNINNLPKGGTVNNTVNVASPTTENVDLSSLSATDLSTLVTQLAPVIRDQLQAGGSNPLNLQSLLPAGSTSSAQIFVDTHSNRLLNYPASNYTVGSVFYETDRTTLYVINSVGGILTWVFASGTYVAAFASEPVDLGTNDVGFLFFATDQDQLYIWKGAAWDTTTKQILFGANYLILAASLTANRTITFPDATGTVPLATGVGAHTITLVKLTGGGSNGSITWNANGLITAWVDPT